MYKNRLWGYALCCICLSLITRDLKPTDENGDPAQTLLSQSIVDAVKDCESLKNYIAAGNDVNARDEFGLTLLMYAAKGRIDVVRMLIKAGAQVNARHMLGGTSALMMAAAHPDKLDVVQELIAAGACVNAPDFAGKTPLMCAAQGGNENIVALLISAGADIDAQNDADETALILAAKAGNYMAVFVLAMAGAFIDSVDCAGKTAIAYASEYNQDCGCEDGKDCDCAECVGRRECLRILTEFESEPCGWNISLSALDGAV